MLNPAEVTGLLAALRTSRDTAMVHAMLFGGLRRCEALGLRLADVHLAGRRLFVADGKGGHQRIIPVSGQFFTALAAYLNRKTAPRRVGGPRVRRAQGPEPRAAPVGGGGR